MARSVLEIILRLKGDKARKELKKVDKGFDKVEKSAKKSGASLKKFDAKMALVAGGAGLAAAGVVKLGQAIWNMGKRGAIVQQTEESFDGLIKKLDLAADLEKQLDQAARGTIDTLNLQSATATLLAGTTLEMGHALGEAAPRILEIAKAANKLNPSLGTTTQLYKSLMEGIKRSSPMKIDDTGLTLKLGEANAEYAEKLGITVEQMSAFDNQMALLNATEEAGALLIAQVGGNLDAAGDAMARTEVKAKNLADELATKVEPAVTDFSNALLDGIEAMDAQEAVLQSVIDAEKDLIITKEESKKILYDYLEGIIDAAGLTRKLEQETRNWRSEMGLLDFQLVELTGHERAYVETLQDAGEESEEAALAAEEFAKRMNRVNQESADAIDTLRGLVDIKIKDFFDVDLNIGDVAARMFDITNFKEFGGEALEIMVHEVQAGLVQEKITSDQAREFFKNIAIEAAAIEVQMGEIDVTDAAKAIADEFNVPLAESRELLDEVLAGVNLVNSADISAITKEFDALEERKQKLIEAGEIPIEADPQDQAQQALDGLQEQVDLLTADPWIIEFKIVTTGEIPTGGGGTVKVGHPDHPDFQHGGDFVVPSGFTRVGLPIMVHSGERVSVRTKGQAGEPSVVNNYLNNTQHFYNEEAAALGLAVVRKFGRDRLNASMGR